ncbi:MAG: hypothetical protein HDP28_02955 [Clostridia bacterium]|nr:hypothetical protein [Clostridia bacterium]
MKRITILFAVWFGIALMALPVFIAPTPNDALTARAESEVYAVAETSDVWFYKTESEEDKLFCIPKTYYVKVISRGERFSFCEYLRDITPYQKVTGYCLTDSLTFVDFAPQRPYLYREVTVQYVPSDGDVFDNGTFSVMDVTFVYYGTRKENDQLYFYVGKNDKFGYVPAKENISYEFNTDYLPEVGEPTSGSVKSSGGLSAVQIVLITLAAVVVLVVAVFIAHGKKTTPSENFEL